MSITKMDTASFLSLIVVLTWRQCWAIGPYNARSYTLVSPSVPEASSYFGYSVVLRDGPVPQISVGAPRASSLHPAHSQISEPGAVHICSLGELDAPVKCDQLFLDVEGTSHDVISRELKYEHGKDNMWLGAAMTGTQTINGTLVVCAPRWVNRYYEHQQHYFANGLCYTLPNTKAGADDALMLLPLVDQYKQGFHLATDLATSSYGTISYLYAFGQAGMSVHLTEDNRQLLIGAPGVFVWTGSIIRYSLLTQTRGPDYYHKQKVPNTYYTPDIKEGSYFGYSVDSGHFTYGTSLQYVGGAPRGAENFGQVFIFEYGVSSEGRLLVQASLAGAQLGAYFGASVCVLDVDADGIDDLAVGAPMHAERKPSSTHPSYDEGRVYIYLSRPSEEKKINFELAQVLDGDAESSARFGSYIANLGDLNGDGYPELGIGAPYADDGAGAMFVYSGSETGVNPKYLQRISAPPHLKGFGISVSKGVDIDRNGCNDVAIGAYSSGHVAVLRCHPTIRVHAHIVATTSPTVDSPVYSALFCLLANESVPGAYAELVVRIGVDPSLSRAYLADMSLSEYEVKLVGNVTSCKDIIIILKENKDFSRPIEMTMDYEMKSDPRKTDKFCGSCGLVAAGGTSQRVSLARGCSEAVCHPDLVLAFNQTSIEHVIGSGERVAVHLSVHNMGEPAFLPTVHVELPTHVQPARLPYACRYDAAAHRDEAHIVCDLPNPLLQNKTAYVELELDVVALWGGAASSWLHARAASAGDESNHYNNKNMLKLDWVTRSEVSLSSLSFPEQDVLIDQLRLDSGRKIIIAHAYKLNNVGPTPWSNVELTFLMETGLPDHLENVTLVDVYEPMATINEQAIECTLSSGYWYTLSRLVGEDVSLEGSRAPPELSARRRRQADEPSCTSKTCLLARCAIGHLQGDQTITLDFQMSIDSERIATVFKNVDDITITSHAVIKSLGISSDMTWQHEASTHSTLRAVRAQTSIAWLIAAVFAGIVTLAILTYALYKFGFFRRKKQDEMRLLKKQDHSGDEDSVMLDGASLRGSFGASSSLEEMPL